MDVLGTVEVKAIGVDIQEGATLNGNGGGYAGGARRTSSGIGGRKNGSGPGSGQGGYTYTGGAGAGHGKLYIHIVLSLNLRFDLIHSIALCHYSI